MISVFLHDSEAWSMGMFTEDNDELSSQYSATEPALLQLANSVALSTQPLSKRTTEQQQQ